MTASTPSATPIFDEDINGQAYLDTFNVEWTDAVREFNEAFAQAEKRDLKPVSKALAKAPAKTAPRRTSTARKTCEKSTTTSPKAAR